MDDTFPYKRYFLPDTPAEYFRRAQEYQPQLVEERVRDQTKLLRPDSVVSRTSRQDFLRHFYLSYGKTALIIRTPKGSYDSINVLPDYYTEDARVRDIGADMDISPYDYWVANRKSLESRCSTIHDCRELLWKIGPKEARQGKITNYLTLFSFLGSRIVLDPSAAWGDRLIAALASPTVEVYTGVDPHSRLPRGWREIIDQLTPPTKKRENFVMLNEPFESEDATPLPEMGKYDTVLISTAPLYGDQYDAGNPLQAVARHGSSYKSYIKGFIIPYLNRSIAALGVGGKMCITVLDRIRDGYFITELKMLLVESLMDNVMSYKGAIMWEGDSGSLVPWWIFEKRPPGSVSEKRLADTKRLLIPYKSVLS